MPCTDRLRIVSRSLLLRIVAALPCLAAPAVAADSIGLGFPSVQAAYTALSSRPDVSVSEENGWVRLEFIGQTGLTAWSFVPPRHPAWPAVVRRDVLSKSGIPTLVTRFVCEGRRTACEVLYARLRDAGET